MVSCHPKGGAPSCRVNQPRPPFSFVGPAREGIQKNPSVRRPSSATLDSARYSPMNTGMVAKVGKHPAKGLTPAV